MSSNSVFCTHLPNRGGERVKNVNKKHLRRDRSGPHVMSFAAAAAGDDHWITVCLSVCLWVIILLRFFWNWIINFFSSQPWERTRSRSLKADLNPITLDEESQWRSEFHSSSGTTHLITALLDNSLASRRPGHQLKIMVYLTLVKSFSGFEFNFLHVVLYETLLAGGSLIAYRSLRPSLLTLCSAVQLLLLFLMILLRSCTTTADRFAWKNVQVAANCN